MIDERYVAAELAVLVKGLGEEPTPGLSLRPDGEVLRVVDGAGVELGTVPLWRCAPVDETLIEVAVREVLEGLPVADADQVRAWLAEHGVELIEVPGEDYVRVHVNGMKFLAVHRREVTIT